ncbi:MAG: PilZ domain-containing protein [Nitrospira sp.]|nr:PilZ domain-containing protein [Nitrospira sp.]
MTMASPVTSPSVPSKDSADERREWIRIDDRVLMEYRLLTDTGTVNSVETGSTAPEMISAAVTKPTADLLARTGESLIGSPVLPWIMKVDYLLEVILNSLATIAPSSVVMARLTNVNLSGGGVGFASSREFAVGDRISVKMILPPFTPIHTVAEVIRSTSDPQGQGWILATEFVEISANDQEHLIRHILLTQAERLRARRISVL